MNFDEIEEALKDLEAQFKLRYIKIGEKCITKFFSEGISIFCLFISDK